jgi:hypothetical protein
MSELRKYKVSGVCSVPATYSMVVEAEDASEALEQAKEIEKKGIGDFDYDFDTSEAECQGLSEVRLLNP